MEHQHSQQRRNKSRGQPGKQWAVPPRFPNVDWESASSCLFISSGASAFFKVTFRALLCLGMLPPERHASSHARCGLPTSICQCLHGTCVFTKYFKGKAADVIWFRLAGLSDTSCDTSGSYLLWAWGPSSIKQLTWLTAEGVCVQGNIYKCLAQDQCSIMASIITVIIKKHGTRSLFSLNSI